MLKDICINNKEKKMIKTLITSILLLMSTNSFGKFNRLLGEWGSGGGNALVCFKQSVIVRDGGVTDIVSEIKKNNNTIPDIYLSYIKTIEMFDLYEAKKKRGIDSKKSEIIEISTDENIYNYLERLGNRFKGKVDLMKEMITEGKELIPDTQLVFHEFAVEYQNDLGSVTLPSSNCVISTIAAQVNYNEFYEVNIDDRLFNHPKHSKQSKATLVLHELIYAIGRKYFNHTDSGATRNLVRNYISYHDSITEGAVSKSLSDLGFVKNTNDLPQIALQYMNSNTMMTVENSLMSLQVTIELKIAEVFLSKRNVELLEEIKTSITSEGLANLNNFENNFSGEKRLIDIGLKKSIHTSTWQKIHESYLYITGDLIDQVGKKNDWYEQNLLKHLKSINNLTRNDFHNIKGHIHASVDRIRRSIFIYKREKNLEDLIKLIDKRNSKNYFLDDIYFGILRTHICRGTWSTVGPSVIDEESNCYAPVLLGNIIPRA